MSNWTPERVARAVLTAVCEPGDPRLGGLLRQYGAVEAVAALRRVGDRSAWGRRAAALDEAKLLADAERAGLRLLMPGDEEWPDALADLDTAEPVAGLGGSPIALWATGAGHLAEWSTGAVAVVGARAATRYGEAVATTLAADLSDPERGRLVVVSGGAYGVDAAAHRGALAAGGRTIGVYAGGLDEPYPRGNSTLFERLAGEQLVVSEVAPGIRAQRAGFLARNRLIAALTVGAVVVEAAARSGARNTASWAAELGRVVMAVPGSVHSAMSTGCHRMIRDGHATLVCDSDDVLALVAQVGTGPHLPTRGEDRPLDELPPQLMAVREAIPARRAVHVSELSVACGFSVAQTLSALAELELLGLVGRDDEGAWRVRRPARPGRVSA